MSTRERTARLGTLDHEHLWHPHTQQMRRAHQSPLIIESAKGCMLVDTAGKSYIDGCSSQWTNIHGHRHPRLDQALFEQASRVAHSTLLDQSHPPAIELAHRLVGLAPWGLKRVFYSDTGSTATEVALKMAFHFQQRTNQTKRVRFATLSGGHHGEASATVSNGTTALFQQIYKPILSDALALPAPVEPGGDEEAACSVAAMELLEAHGHELAALIVEPLVQGAAGMKMHTADYLRPILNSARDKGVLLIADEVGVGFARTGTLFAMEQVGVTPDFLCLANGLAAGYLPLAATLTTEPVYEAFLDEPTAHHQLLRGHTFTGNPLACSVALASLDLFEEDGLLEQTVETARHLRALLQGWPGRPGVKSVRQTGLMVGIDLIRRDGTPWPPSIQMGHRVVMRARTLGAIVRTLGNTILLNPPLSIQPAELTSLVKITSAAIQAELD